MAQQAVWTAGAEPAHPSLSNMCQTRGTRLLVYVFPLYHTPRSRNGYCHHYLEKETESQGAETCFGYPARKRLSRTGHGPITGSPYHLGTAAFWDSACPGGELSSQAMVSDMLSFHEVRDRCVRVILAWSRDTSTLMCFYTRL